MAGEDGEGALDLLGEEDAGELVRHRQRRQRNLEARGVAQLGHLHFGVMPDALDVVLQ